MIFLEMFVITMLFTLNSEASNVAAEWLVFLFHIPDISDSDSSLENGYPE
jgi:hypothetical protein